MVYNRQNLNRTVAPVYEPITLAEAKAYCRLDDSFVDDDALLMDLIKTATSQAEKYTRRALITQTWTLTMDRFPQPYVMQSPLTDGYYDLPVDYAKYGGDCFELYNPPIQSVSSIVTYDDDNSATTFSASNYRLDTTSGRVYLNPGQVWPSDLRDFEAVVVTFVCGYGDNPHNVPETIRTAIKFYVRELYMGRDGCEIPMACKNMLNDYRLIDRLGASQR